MGFFDLFKGGKDKPVEEKRASAAAKWAAVARDKRAQNYDRQEALVTLAGMETSDAAAALLRRFDFHMDPSITDQEEKQIAFEGVIAAGENAVEPVRAYAAKAESLAWPMKILKQLLEEDAYVEELVSWLARWDVEYAKFVDPKIQLLVALEDHKNPLIRSAVE
ncbi:MAG: HEAT repeat domain-containing protein, partial [Polyangiaceae bacterium]